MFLFWAGIFYSFGGACFLIYGLHQVVEHNPFRKNTVQRVGTYSYPDEYVERLPGIITDPREKLDSIWPLYKMPDTDRFYLIGKWKCLESGAPTKSEQTWVQKVR